MAKKILVTGGAGFVGSYLSLELTELDHSVTVVDDFSTGKKQYMQSVKHRGARILKRNILDLERGVDEFDIIFHLAARPFSKSKIDWFSESQPVFQTNVIGTYNILRLTKPDCHFIFISSASVYGEGCKLSETSPYHSQSAYGYSKTLAEQIVVHSPRQYTILRPGTIIGPRGRCFPNRVMWSLAHEKPCNFFKKGSVLRDIIDVRDVVRALVKIMDNKELGIFNLGTNTEIKGFYLVSYAKRLAQKKHLNFIPILTSFVPQDFVVKSTLNSDKLQLKLNWKPVFTLSESLKTIFDYYQHDPEASEPPSWDSL